MQRISTWMSRRRWLAGVTAVGLVCGVGVVALVAQATPEAAPETQEPPPDWTRARRVQMSGPWGGSQIGVSIRDVEDGETSAGDDLAEGAVVTDVREDGAADQAGLEVGDIVVEFDRERVRSARQLTRLVQETPSGRSVPTAVVRNGRRVELEVVPSTGAGWLSAIEEPLRRIERFGRDFDVEIRGSRPRLGVQVSPLTPQLADFFGVDEGLLVTSVDADTAAADAGLQAGDVITALDGGAVADVIELRRRIATLESGRGFTIQVTRDRDAIVLDGRLDEDATDRRSRDRAI